MPTREDARAATTRATRDATPTTARPRAPNPFGGVLGLPLAATATATTTATAPATTTATAPRADARGDVARAAYAQLAQYPRVLLPTTDAVVYVNAKQYHAIVRRRQKRAKAHATRPPGVVNAKHPSRSAHAKNRIRGANGKYLTRDALLRGAGGPEAQARAQAREREIAERERKRVERAATREAAKARARAARAAAAAVRAAKQSSD